MSFYRRSTSLVLILILLSGLSFGLILSWFESNDRLGDSPENVNSSAVTDTLDEKRNQDSLYRQYFKNGEDFYSRNELKQAITSFEMAQKLKPTDFRLKERIAEIKGKLAEQERKHIEYGKALASGDAYFNARDYLNAKASYQVAIDNYPDDTLAKGKLRKTMDLLRSQKAQNILYDVAVASADKLFREKDYDRARIEYENASKMMPKEQYSRNKINEIIKIQIDKQVSDELYAKAVANGDKFFAGKSYQSSLLEFQKAQGILPDEIYPKQKIAELIPLIAEQKARDEAYNKAILTADQFFQQTRYAESVKGYRQALTVKPEESYPKSRISEIENILSLRKKQQEEYDFYLALADSMYIEKSFLRARENYSRASSVKPSESYPKDMISKTDKMLTGQEAEMAKIMAIEEQYRLSVASADKLFDQKQYGAAKTDYQKASGYKPAESYPKVKITEIDSILFSLVQLQDREKQYDSLIVSADKELGDLAYDQAKSDYQKALVFKPKETYPTTKIAEIDDILRGIAQQKSAAERYQSTILRADSLFILKDYERSRTGYQDALKIRPSETYPANRLTEITQILTLLAKEKAIDEQYSALIFKGDDQIKTRQYPMAKVSFEQALQLKPEEKLPKDKIAAIDSILTSIEARKALDDQYASIIVKGDQLLAARSFDQARIEYVNAGNLKPAVLAARSFDQARIEYVNAGNLKPAEQYPKDRIAEIDKHLGEVAAKKALDEQYAKTIADADKLFNEKAWDQSRLLYVQSGELKPAETYPKTRISEIDKILAELAKQKALDEEYNASIASADSLFREKALEMARVGYVKAGELKPVEAYPKSRIAEIDKQLADLASRKAIDDQYNTAIVSADKFFGEKDYEQARTGYINAGKIKPSELYPKEKITEIGTLLAEIAKQKALDDQYASIIVKGDQLLAARSFDQARIEYVNAGKIKSAEQYPKDKIAEIDGILNEIKEKEEAYKTTITNADQLFSQKKYDESSNEYQNALLIKPDAKYPADKISEINQILTELKGKRQTYEELVAKGEVNFTQKEWMKAKSLFQQALTVLPEEKYPKEKISQIGYKIDSIYRANKVRYDQAIEEGDKFYNSYEFDKAIDSYTVASELLTMENYPREMISKIRRTIAENAIVDVLKTPVTLRAGEEKQFSFAPVNMASRKNNFIYVKVRNLSSKPFNVLLRYGQDKSPGGGVVIRNLSADGKVNERLISVKDQDSWYRIDNNWISLYPQGGDIEVSFIQVSRAQRQ